MRRFEVESLTNFRGHTSKILTVSCCKSYSIAVTGDLLGSIIIWDLNRKQYVKSIEFGSHIITTQVNGNTGDFLVCNDTTLGLWDINGNQLDKKVVSNNSLDTITTAAFFDGPEWLVFDTILIVTGHSNGDVRFWSRDINLSLSATLSIPNPVSCISWAPSFRYLLLVSKREVYACVMPDGSGTEIHYLRNEEGCNRCGAKFTVLDRKFNCKACGGQVCTNCIMTPNSLCSNCRVIT